MKFVVHGTNLELTVAIRNFIDEKLGAVYRLLAGARDVIEMRVEVGKPSRHHRSGPVFYAEVNLKLGRKLLRAEATDRDLYTAIDQVRDGIERHIKRFKEKRPPMLRRR